MAPQHHPRPLPVFMAVAPHSEVAKIDTVETTTTTGPPAPQPLAASARRLALNQAIRRALESDPQIPAGLEAIRQSEADLVTAGLLPNPELYSDLLMMPWGKPFTVEKQGGPPQTDYFITFPIDWFLFGKRVAAIETAQKRVDVNLAQFADLVRQRISGTIAAFYDVLEAQAQLELARADLDALFELEKITSTRVELGGIGSIESDRVKLGIFSARRELRSRDLLLTTAQAQLRSFLGYADEVPLQLDGTLDVAEPAEPLTVETAFQLAAENRPDLIALQREIEMADAGVTLEERKAWPQVKPAFGFTRQFQQEFFGYPDANSWNVAMQMTLPVFDRNQGNIDKARSVKTQAELNRQAQLVALRAEIVQTAKSFEAARAALIIDDPGQLEAAQHVRDKIRAAYELGGKPLIDVLDSQRAYRETFRLHIASRSSYWHSLYALNAAVGKQVLR
jgi:cobalt-zinc-cadmium efflux system outer membrane protein